MGKLHLLHANHRNAIIFFFTVKIITSRPPLTTPLLIRYDTIPLGDEPSRLHHLTVQFTTVWDFGICFSFQLGEWTRGFCFRWVRCVWLLVPSRSWWLLFESGSRGGENGPSPLFWHSVLLAEKLWVVYPIYRCTYVQKKIDSSKWQGGEKCSLFTRIMLQIIKLQRLLINTYMIILIQCV